MARWLEPPQHYQDMTELRNFEIILGETRKVSSVLATIGVVSNPDQKNIKIGKAVE